MRPENFALSPETLHRRRFLVQIAALSAAIATATTDFAEAADATPGVTFSFGTYGMKTMKTEDAIRTVADIGYDAVEITVRPDWDAAPQQMTAARRREVRTLLALSGLRLTAVMEHLFPAREPQAHQAGLDRLKQVAELAQALSPDLPPLIQTVLGDGSWEEQKGVFVDRLGDWARLAEQTRTVIAIKPHRGGAMSQPAEAVWLIQQLGDTPWIRMVYDYSHYAFRDMTVAATVATALPYTKHIAIKDAVETAQGIRFVLPGASQTFDYADLFRRLYAGGYRDDICCEVSGMVWSQPGYDPIAAAQQCYAQIAPAFDQAGVPRRRV